jgi:superfamily II DNA or RNA helicase
MTSKSVHLEYLNNPPNQIAWTIEVSRLADATSDQLKEFLSRNLSKSDLECLKLSKIGLPHLRRHCVALATKKGFVSSKVVFAMTPLRTCSYQFLAEYLVSRGKDVPVDDSKLVHLAMREAGETFVPVARGENLRRRLTEKCLVALAAVLSPARFYDEAQKYLAWTYGDAAAHKDDKLLVERVSWLSSMTEKFKELKPAIAEIGHELNVHFISFLQFSREDLLFCRHFVHRDVLQLEIKVAGIANVGYPKENGFFASFKGVISDYDLREPQRGALNALRLFWEKWKPLSPCSSPTELSSLMKLRSWFSAAVDLSYVECSSLPENFEVPAGEDEVFAEIARIRPTASSDPPLIVIPTGVGKSVVLYLAPLTLKKKPGRVLVVCPTVQIRNQLKDGYESFFEDDDDCESNVFAGTELASKAIKVLSFESRISFSDLIDADVVVCTAMALSGLTLLETFPPDFFGLVLVDEAHHAEARSYCLIREHFCGVPFVFVTGTPVRGDSKEIRAELIFQSSMKDAINQRYVKNVCWALAPVISIELRSKVKSRGNDVLDKRQMILHASGLTRLIVDSTSAKSLVIGYAIQLLRKIRLSGVAHQVILQASNVEEALQLRTLWREHSINRRIRDDTSEVVSQLTDLSIKTNSGAVNAESISSDEKLVSEYEFTIDYVASTRTKEENSKVIFWLRTGALHAIIHVGMLGEGFDHPNLSICCIFRNFGSFAPFAQFVGRVIRRISEASDEDNIAYVISHPALGLQSLWELFKTESEDQNLAVNRKSLKEWDYIVNQTTSDENDTKLDYFLPLNENDE